MLSLNPVTQTVLVLVSAMLLIFADMITTNIEISRSEDDANPERISKLKSSLSDKMNLTFIGFSLVLVFFSIKFVIFLFGHFHRIL